MTLLLSGGQEGVLQAIPGIKQPDLRHFLRHGNLRRTDENFYEYTFYRNQEIVACLPESSR